jgi:hypothetical protein
MTPLKGLRGPKLSTYKAAQERFFWIVTDI